PTLHFLFVLSPITKVAMAGALHDGLRARERDGVAESLGERKIRAAYEEKTELRLAQRLVELRIAAARDIDREGILGLLADVVSERIAGGIGSERRRHRLSQVLVRPALPKCFAEAAIGIAERLSHQRIGARLAQFGLQCLHKRDQDLCLDLRLL